jgi:hypothetical protein
LQQRTKKRECPRLLRNASPTGSISDGIHS